MLNVRFSGCELSFTSKVRLRSMFPRAQSDPDISSKCDSHPGADPNVFLKRYLKKIRDLGEVGPEEHMHGALCALLKLSGSALGLPCLILAPLLPLLRATSGR